MTGGNGAMFRARSEQDAKLFVEELQNRPRRRPSRRARRVALVLIGLLVVLGAVLPPLLG